MDFGNISTNIIKKGLVFNMDAANRASTIPVSTVETSFNTVNLSQSGSFSDNGIFDSSTITPSFAFGGTDDNINLNMDLSSYDSLSVGIWCYYTNTTNYRYAFSAGSSNVAGTALGIAAWTGGYEIYTWDGATSHRTSTNSPSSTWTYIVVTHIGTERKVYVNGSLVSTFSSGNLNLNSTTKIGSWTDNNFYMIGNTGPVHIYNRALSASEVLFNYNGLKSRFGL
jgi:hypothetical protein